MLDNIEYEQQKAKEDVLCGKSEKIDMDMPSQEMSLTFNYAECEKVARQKASPVPVNSASLISRYLTVNTSSIALIKQKKAIQRELALFEKENADLAKDERFSDTYYFRLAGFYSLIKNYEKEGECLSQIKDKENAVYAAKIAENELRQNENTEENLQLLYKLNTAESVRKLSGFYLSNKELDKAEEALNHYRKEHDEIPYEIDFQQAFVFMQKGDANKAIHFLRQSFYTQNTPQAALALSMLYLIQATKYKRLVEKARLWCKIAVNLDISFTPALRLYVNMELEKQPEKVEFILFRYLKLNNVTEKDFYFDAAINHAKCAFVKEKYGAALDRLGNLTDNKTNQAAVWNNIALCNASVGKLDRAERNIAKALEKFQENKTDIAKNQKPLEIILTNYMRILNRQGKYNETLSLFENTNGSKDFELSEENYLNYFAEWRKALLASGNFETYFNFLLPIFMLDSDNLTLKLFACNDLLRFLTLTGQNKEQMKACRDFLMQIHRDYPHGKHNVQVLNNIVFANLEMEDYIPEQILKDFISTIGQNPCNTATYGLYLLRRKGQTERGLSYYDKAISMAQKDSAYTNMIEELRLKKDIESARCLIESGDLNSARRLLDKSYKHASKTLKGYQQSIERLLEEC